MRIIDCHCHVYPDKIAERASSATGEFYGLPVRYDGKISTLDRLSRAAGVDACLIFSVATHKGQAGSVNRYIADTVAANPAIFRGLGTVHPDDENIAEEIDEIERLGLKGVKLHADIQRIAIDDPRCMKIYELCRGRLPVLLHTGDYRFSYSNPENLLPVLKAFPDLSVIAAHLGGWSVWEDAKKHLPDFSNLSVDTCSSLGFLSKEEARALISAYGAERVLFGTDYPMWNPKEEVDALLSLGLTDAENRRIFAENAERLFGF